MKNVKFIIFVLLVVLISVSISSGICSAHEEIPYKIYIVNQDSPILLTGDIDLKTKKLVLEFNDMGITETIEIKVGEIIGNYYDEDINIFNTFWLECKRTTDFQRSEFEILKLKKGITLVVWVNRIMSDQSITPLDKKQVLERVRIIKLEQARLATVGAIKGAQELANEAGRNMEE